MDSEFIKATQYEIYREDLLLPKERWHQESMKISLTHYKLGTWKITHGNNVWHHVNKFWALESYPNNHDETRFVSFEEACKAALELRQIKNMGYPDEMF